MKETLQGKPKGGKAQTGGTGEHSAKINKRHRDRIRGEGPLKSWRTMFWGPYEESKGIKIELEGEGS
jgi:hypothetical protein